MESQSFEFAGVKSKLTSRGQIRKPALIKILRSGKVRVVTRQHTTDDYAGDAYSDFGRGRERCPLRLANDLENGGDGWWTNTEKDGAIGLNCGSFLYLTVVLASDVAVEAKTGTLH